eukprot:10799149-Prorocentrum_lima.AAC.1
MEIAQRVLEGHGAIPYPTLRSRIKRATAIYSPPNAFEVFAQKEDHLINDANYEHVRVVLEDRKIISRGT